jgi:predicted membrane metal-binding protein
MDPVRARRARVAAGVKLAKRVGYLLFLAAIVLFFYGLIVDLTTGLATAIVVCLVAGSIVLLPAIIFGYAVRTAEREDRARGL